MARLPLIVCLSLISDSQECTAKTGPDIFRPFYIDIDKLAIQETWSPDTPLVLQGAMALFSKYCEQSTPINVRLLRRNES